RLLAWGGEPDYLDLRDSDNNIIGYDCGRQNPRIPYPTFEMDPVTHYTIYKKGLPRALVLLNAAEATPTAPVGCIWVTNAQANSAGSSATPVSSGTSYAAQALEYERDPSHGGANPPNWGIPYKVAPSMAAS